MPDWSIGGEERERESEGEGEKCRIHLSEVRT